jgi:Tfp pilus assembly protein PilE
MSRNVDKAKIYKSKGFTIVEALVTIAITALAIYNNIWYDYLIRCYDKK